MNVQIEDAAVTAPASVSAAPGHRTSMHRGGDLAGLDLRLAVGRPGRRYLVVYYAGREVRLIFFSRG